MFMQELTPIIANLGNTNTEIILAGDTNINERDVYSDFSQARVFIQKSHSQPGSQTQEVH